MGFELPCVSEALRITISTSHSSALRKAPRTGEGDRGSVGTVDERSGSVVRGRGSGRACMKRKGSGIPRAGRGAGRRDRKSTRLNSSHGYISYAVFCLKKKNHPQRAQAVQ